MVFSIHLFNEDFHVFFSPELAPLSSSPVWLDLLVRTANYEAPHYAICPPYSSYSLWGPYIIPSTLLLKILQMLSSYEARNQISRP
jgi:hypothetical protein